MGIDLCHRLRAADRELVEEGRVETQRIAWNFDDLFSGIVCFGGTKFGHLAQAGLPEQAQVHRSSQCKQTLVGTDVGSGAFPLDMLLTGSER